MVNDDTARLDYLTKARADAGAEAAAMLEYAETFRRNYPKAGDDPAGAWLQSAMDNHVLLLATRQAKARHELNVCRAYHGLPLVDDSK